MALAADAISLKYRSVIVIKPNSLLFIQRYTLQ